MDVLYYVIFYFSHLDPEIFVKFGTTLLLTHGKDYRIIFECMYVLRIFVMEYFYP